MQVVNEYRLVNKRGSKVLLSSTWATNDPLERQIHLKDLCILFCDKCDTLITGNPEWFNIFPHSSLDLLVILWALRECWINALKFAGVYFFREYDLHVLPGVKKPLWGIGEMFSFYFFWGGDRGGHWSSTILE